MADEPKALAVQFDDAVLEPEGVPAWLGEPEDPDLDQNEFFGI